VEDCHGDSAQGCASLLELLRIHGTPLEIFEKSEGGKHFMFMDNPDKFNRIVRDFTGQGLLIPRIRRLGDEPDLGHVARCPPDPR
jgi:hypothetical protein